MGVLYRKRDDGAWWVFVNHRGRRWAKKVGAKEAAKAVARKMQEALATGTLNLARADAPLFKDYALAWLQQHRQVNGIKEATVQNYDKSIRLYLVPAFGAMPLTAIDRAAVKGFIARLREAGSVLRPGQGLGQGSVKLMLAPLRLILGEAVDAGLIQSNPAARVGKFNKRRTEQEAEGCDPFDAKELEAIAVAARDHVQALWPLVGLWAQSGMRAGEVFGLQWKDINLEAGTAVIRRTLSQGKLGSPKTPQSVRTVNLIHPLLPQPGTVVEALRDLRSAREAEAAVAGRGLGPEAFVFTRPGGEPWRSISHHWERCLRLADVRYRNPEQLRHTFASTLLSRGYSLLYVQQQGGWANATVLLTYYARWIPREAPAVLQPAATPAQLGSETS